MSYRTALATREELAAVGQLIDDYVRQNLDMEQWPVARETFQTDYDNGCFQLMVVYNSTDQLVGFAAWLPHYDLHHCTRGSLVIDLYIEPVSRGRGLAAALISAIAAIAVDQGQTFLRGSALGHSASRLYDRVAVCFGSGEYNLSGKALRQVASLAGKSPQEMILGLPTRAMNYDP